MYAVGKFFPQCGVFLSFQLAAADSNWFHQVLKSGSFNKSNTYYNFVIGDLKS